MRVITPLLLIYFVNKDLINPKIYCSGIFFLFRNYFHQQKVNTILVDISIFNIRFDTLECHGHYDQKCNRKFKILSFLLLLFTRNKIDIL